jgi:AcrR family transcriptional regulator
MKKSKTASAGGARGYRLGKRATLAEATGRRILDAALDLFCSRPFDDVSLQEVASKAGVTVQTVLRRFGSKEELVAAVAEQADADVRTERAVRTPGLIDEAIRLLSEHYESWGARMGMLVSQESRVPALARMIERAKRVHYDWVEDSFAPQLAAAPAAKRPILRAQLIAATDLSVWNILRNDLGLDPAIATEALRGLVHAIIRTSNNTNS